MMVNNLNNKTGWLDKYRPATLNDCVLPKSRQDFFGTFIDNKRPPNILLHGDYGIGKTTIAKILAEKIGSYSGFHWNSCHQYIRFDSVREAKITSDLIDRLVTITLWDDETRIWVFDEIDKLQIKYQNRFLGVLEDQTCKNAFFLIANDIDKIDPGIVNRSLSLDMQSEYQDEMILGLTNMGAKILKKEQIKFSSQHLKQLAEKNWRCPRIFINSLETFSLGGELRPL